MMALPAHSCARVAVLLALLGATSCSHAADPIGPSPVPIDTLAIRTHTSVLAHDSMGGRGTGSAGARASARYLAAQLRALGLHPVSGSARTTDAFLDPVPLLRADLSRATLSIDGGAHAHGDGFVVGRIGREGLRDVDAPVIALSGDSAAVPAGAWLLLEAALGEAAMRWVPVWRERGVAGLLVRLPGETAVDAYRAQLGDVRWQLRDGAPDPVWQPDLPVLLIGPALAHAALEPGARVAFHANARMDTVIDHNVAGILDGRSRDELVVLTAHYDHLGIVPGAARGDSIYNGFSDNAAGVSMLLAIARSASATPPERSLLFLFPTAEEVGVLGSLHFVRTHPELVARAHALLNLDAGAPPAPPTRWRLAAGTRSWAGAVAASVVEAHGWAHRSDPGSPNSDHWPFVMLGVPAVFLIPDGGFEDVDDAGARLLVEQWDHYHQPDDEWAADFPFSGLERYASLGLQIAYALASHAGPDE